MLLSNPYRPDLRVQREAHSLSQMSYAVRIIAWDRMAELAVQEDDHGIEIQRIQHVRSVYYGGLRQVLVFPLFWNAAAQLTSKGSPDIVHCHDLDTLYAGVQIKFHTGCKLVYDAHEHYPAMLSLYLPGFFIRWLERLERQLIRRVDLVLTASSMLAERYRNQGIDPVVVLPNSPELDRYDNSESEQINRGREALGVNKGELCVGYIGGFTRNRLVLPLIEAVKGLENVRLFIWGDGIQKPSIEQAVKQTPQAVYLGWLSPEKVPLFTSAMDVIYYALQPDYPGAEFNAPNALGNAMAAGIPVIANRVGDLGNIIQKEQCGLLLDVVTPQAIREALLSLQNDPQRRKALGHAGRLAAECEYNWTHSARRLTEAYLALNPGHIQNKN